MSHVPTTTQPQSPTCRREEALPPIRLSSLSSGPGRPVPALPSVPPWAVRVSSRWTFARLVVALSITLEFENEGLADLPIFFSLLQEFNARTANIVTGTPMPCRVTVRADRSFVFDIRTPQTSWLLLNAVEAPFNKKGQRKGASNPGTESVGTISLKHVYEIAKIKQTELRLSGLRLEGLCRAIIYQCKSIGIDVVA